MNVGGNLFGDGVVVNSRMDDSYSHSRSSMIYNVLVFMWNCCRLYGWQVLLGSILSGMAAFRREMSSNRIYHPEEDEDDHQEIVEDVSTDNNHDVILEKLLDPLLEGAGRVCSGGPLSAILYAMFHYSPILKVNEEEPEMIPLPSSSTNSTVSEHPPPSSQPARLSVMLLAAQQWLNDNGAGTLQPDTADGHDITGGVCWLLEMPCDVLIHVGQYLEAKDVLSLGCTNVSLHHTLLSSSNTSTQLWFTLWKRDYPLYTTIAQNDILSSVIARSFASSLSSAFQNSPSIICHYFQTHQLIPHTIATTTNNNNNSGCCCRESMLDFYWKMGPTWINHFCAGFCTDRKCLTGLHGHVLDITDFMNVHPGSKETLITLGAGKDASLIFEHMGHSKKARDMVSDLYYLHPHHNIPQQHGTLARIRTNLQQEEKQAKRNAQKQLSSNIHVLGNINVYYDIFQGKWFAWHMEFSCEPVFISTPLL